MNKIRPELLERIRKSNEEYKKIESLLTPLGFTLCTGAVFYGERPFGMYCGKMEDYRSFIDNIDSIKEKMDVLSGSGMAIKDVVQDLSAISEQNAASAHSTMQAA